MERNELITRLRPNKKAVSKRKRMLKSSDVNMMIKHLKKTHKKELKGGFLGALIGAVARTAARAIPRLITRVVPKVARVLPKAIPKVIPKGSLGKIGSIASKGVGRLGSVANMANLGLFGYSIYDQIQAKKEAQRLADEGDAQAAKDAAALDASIKEYEQAQKDYESKAASLQNQYSEQLDPNTLFNAISQMYGQSLQQQQPAAAATTTTTQPKRKKKGGFMGLLGETLSRAAAESQKPQMSEAQFMTLIQKLAGDKGVDFINKQKEKKQQQQQQTPLQAASERLQAATRQEERMNEAFANRDKGSSRGREQNPRSREARESERLRQATEQAAAEVRALMPKLPKRPKGFPPKPKPKLITGLPLEGSGGVVGGAFRLSLPKMRVRRPTVLTRIAPKVSAIKGRLGALGNKAQLGSLVSIGFLGYSIQQMVEAKKQAEEAKAMGDAQAAKDAKALDDAIKQYKQSAKDVGASATELESQYKSQVASQQDLLNALGSMFGVQK